MWRECQPASQQGSEEEVKTWQEEPGGGRRSAGVRGKFLVSLFTYIQEVCFYSLVSQGLAGLPVPVFDGVEQEETFA